MNKKGFTTIEIVLSFTLVVLILTGLTVIVINYRDKVPTEEIKTQLLDYKNTITKIVYDDIVKGDYVSLQSCIDAYRCVNFIKPDGTSESLKVINQLEDMSGIKTGMYIEYKGIKYMLPDSDLNSETGYVSDIKEFVNEIDNTYGLYSVKIPLYHAGINYGLNISLVIN